MPKWLPAVVAVGVILIAVLLAPHAAADLLSWISSLLLLFPVVVVNVGLPLLIASVLLWFAYWMLLRRWLRLRKLHRIRVAQGRRHPLA